MTMNLTCFKHRTYKGDSAPDLSCKTCCTMFVAKIRAEQNSKFEQLHSKMSHSFSPLMEENVKVSSENLPVRKFDSSWI